MCGISGAYFFKKNNQLSLEAAVKRMSDQMINRGPDAYGFWSDLAGAVGFGHRRLSILDLQARSDQPMLSGDARYTIVFNGEIYNFRELRKQLEATGEHFQTSGDTEVILKLFAKYKENMLMMLRGMFSLVIWDSLDKKIFIARDPYGIKPLYYSLNQEHFIFASQVKAIQASKLVSDQPSPLGQAGFWLMGSVPEPYTWFKDIYAHPAGSWSIIDSAGQMQTHKYWDINQSWLEAPECKITHEEIQKRVSEAVYESVKAHLVSDVPVGVFLSGGIDSGSVAGHIMDTQVQSMHGFTIAFEEFRGRHEDESQIAASVAQQYHFLHDIRYVNKTEFENDLPRILKAMDQPTLDGINTWYATKAAREKNMKVVLSGVGGDELFWGYPSFSQIPRLHQWASRINSIPVINSLAQLALLWRAHRSKNQRWADLLAVSQTMYGAYWLKRGLYTLSQLRDLMGVELFESAMNQFKLDDFISSQVGPLSNHGGCAVAQLESNLYLKNQLLRDSDWASMDHSVELRTPLIDAWLLKDLVPVLKSFHKFPHKTLLAKSPKIPLSDSIIYRKKTGFGLPLGFWLQDAVIKNGLSQDLKFSKVNVSQGGSESRVWAKIVTQNVYQSF